MVLSKITFSEISLIKLTDIKIDKYFRELGYSINLEYCGAKKPMYVLRRCGEFISANAEKKNAILDMIIHDAERIEKLTGITII